MDSMLTEQFNRDFPSSDRRNVYSYGELAGQLILDGNGFSRYDWKWLSANTPASKLLEDGNPSRVPFFLKVLQPEGWLADELLHGNPKDPAYLKEGLRYLSNITIVDGNSHLMDGVAIDRHEVHLTEYTGADGVFNGCYSGPAADKISGAMEQQVAALWKSPVMPKFSGAQIKIPMSLHYDGVLSVANPTAFTHILKLPGDGHFQSLGAVEWMALELSDAAGLQTSKHALVDMPCDMPPALVVERFDIPEKDDEHSRYLISDFCSLGNLDPETYKRSLSDKKCIDVLKKASTDPDNMEALFKRLAFAYIIGDYDAHLKNLSVIKQMDVRNPNKISIKFSPTYDAVTTTVFMPKLRKLSVSIGGAYDNVSLDQLTSLGKKCGLNPEIARAMILDMAEAIAFRAADIANKPPEIAKKYPECALALKLAATDIIDRVSTLGANVPDWCPIRPTSERLAAIQTYFDKKEGKIYRPIRPATESQPAPVQA